MKQKLLMPLTILIMLIVAGCGGAASPPTPAPPVATAAEVTRSEAATSIPVAKEQKITEEVVEAETITEDVAEEASLQDKASEDTAAGEELPTVGEGVEAEDLAGETAVEAAPVATNNSETESDSAPAVEVNWLTNEGRTKDGFAFLGNPNAAVTLTDYSDFL